MTGEPNCNSQCLIELFAYRFRNPIARQIIVITKLALLQQLDNFCRKSQLNDVGDIQWSDGQVVRYSTIRTERGDPDGWHTFLSHLQSNCNFANGIRCAFLNLRLATINVFDDSMSFQLSHNLALSIREANELNAVLDPPQNLEIQNKLPDLKHARHTMVMFIEQKPGLTGHARIGRVTTSATRRTIYYLGRKLQSLNGSGYKANYFNVDTGLEYWISNCKKDGNDTLYPGVIEIDEDAREEYWTNIRKLPDKINEKQFRSEGKYSKRRPR